MGSLKAEAVPDVVVAEAVDPVRGEEVFDQSIALASKRCWWSMKGRKGGVRQWWESAATIVVFVLRSTHEEAVPSMDSSGGLRDDLETNHVAAVVKAL